MLSIVATVVPLGGGEEELAKIPMLVMVVAIMILGEVVRVFSKRNRKPEDEFNGLTPELVEQWLLEEAAQAAAEQAATPSPQG